MRPSIELTGKRVSNKIPWSAEAESAFKWLKAALCEAVTLATPDQDKPFWLHTVGACLSQHAANGSERPIAFTSYKFSPMQTRWPTIEQEAFGVIWGWKKFDL